MFLTSNFPYICIVLITSKIVVNSIDYTVNLDHVQNYEIVVNYVVELTTILTVV